MWPDLLPDQYGHSFIGFVEVAFSDRILGFNAMDVPLKLGGLVKNTPLNLNF